METICAISTAQGKGAIAMIRISGEESFDICSKIFEAFSKKSIHTFKANSAIFGYIKDQNTIIDEVIVNKFIKSRSFTGEDTIEISCHGSIYIQRRILQLIINQGIRLARPGEFTQRAFLNGKLDLTQAEAVADLIASESEAAHKIALLQLRGGVSNDLKVLREKLLNFASLIELELDFSEEDVEFANRDQLKNLLADVHKKISDLAQSFKLGNAIKNGIPVAIIGEPNVGKSTLLNTLLNEEKAIVSEIPGTTRDSIEDVITIQGVLFRFIDTAGIRNSTDIIENLGIERTFQKIEKAEIILYLFDIASKNSWSKDVNILIEKYPDKKWIFVANKIDKLPEKDLPKVEEFRGVKVVTISAKQQLHIQNIIDALFEYVYQDNINPNQTIITNSRHFEALTRASEAIVRVRAGLQNALSGEILSQDIREAIYHIGSITGEISNNEVLGNIFGKFCIGK